MTTLVITCRTCGKAHTPSSKDIRAGVWRICADCHESGRSPPNPTRLNRFYGPQTTVLIVDDLRERNPSP